ncbi:hypothetical protein ACPA9J_12985, partial [Pseudomonas aeruginosa]
RARPKSTSFPTLSKRLVHLASTLRSRSHDEKGAIIAALVRRLAERGTVRPRCSAPSPGTGARQAHRT